MSTPADPNLRTQDPDTLAEAVRHLLSSAEGLERAAAAASETGVHDAFVQAAVKRRAIAAPMSAWLEDQGLPTPHEGGVGSIVERAVISAGKLLSGGGDARPAAFRAADAALLRRFDDLLAQAELSKGARRLLTDARAALASSPVKS